MIYEPEEDNLTNYLPDVNMSERDKQIVQKYLTQKTTYKKLGEVYGISGERVRQILVKFYRKVRAAYLKKEREEERS